MATCAVTVISRRLRATLCLMLVASACGSAAAKGRSDDVISSQSVPWSAALATVDGLVVTLHFTGGREYDPDEPCTRRYTFDVVESATEVHIRIIEWRPAPRPAATEVACTLEGYGRSLGARLDRPLGDRVLVADAEAAHIDGDAYGNPTVETAPTRGTAATPAPVVPAAPSTS